jgi:putative membrane protein
MIDYDPHDWWSHFWDIEGTMVRELVGRVAVLTAWAAVVVGIDKTVGDMPVIGEWSISLPLLSLIGAALGFLLVFRTNAAYDKFWEGRKLWGAIVNESRNLTRMALVHLADDPERRDRIIHWAGLWPYLAMHRLRGTVPAAPARITDRLPSAEVDAVRDAEHPVLAVSTRITLLLAEARDRGTISDYVMTAMDQNVQLLIDYIGGCERIVKTPLPFAYVVHVRRALILYCIALPFALVQDFGYGAILDTLVVAFIFFGIEEIGVEIENPFGMDDNDLPLETICSTIARNLDGMAATPLRPGVQDRPEDSDGQAA